MNRVYYLALLLSLAVAFTACKGDKASNSDIITNTTVPANTVVPPAPSGAATATVEHYTCPNGHVGYGAGSAGNCSQCNTPLVHNQAFHANDPAPATPPAPAASPMLNDPAIPAAGSAVTTTPAAPAQNASGVFHYTCGSGCAGGAGAAGNCSNCGAALAHNQAYHN